jgi:hypothetical protein
MGLVSVPRCKMQPDTSSALRRCCVESRSTLCRNRFSRSNADLVSLLPAASIASVNSLFTALIGNTAYSHR